jgi:uncharacterized glyoxalase superfamily protein PhnB
MRVTPMLHVSDIAATAAWYEQVGFTIRDTASDGQEVVWAAIRFGETEVMLSAGGEPSDKYRREVDLYVHVDDIDAIFTALPPGIDVVEPPHDTFYGMREFIIRDCNRFWVSFGHPLARENKSAVA